MPRMRSFGVPAHARTTLAVVVDGPMSLRDNEIGVEPVRGEAVSVGPDGGRA
ncbi:hypothetical protein DFJ68_3295 [Terracoccus luteus]|uniref:Uncharacterized protein n=1 Tax=Terracoccus luteus TaxID=53356 RepID=A0A495XZU4_9MICO|nr:hypothetical protein DFJ68_3295 [Terracoccus luteus]